MVQAKKKLVLIEGGVHKVYEGTYRIFDKLFDLEIITASKSKIQGLRTTHFPEKRIFRVFFTYYPGLYRYLKKRRFDIIHVKPYYRPYALVALLYSIIHHKPFFISEEQRNDPHNKIDRFFFNSWLFFIKPLINLKVKKFIALTGPAFKYLKNKGFRRLVHIPVPYFFKKQNIAKRKGGLKIITVARFDWLKAHNVLIKAVSHLLTEKKLKRSEIQINLVGRGGLLEDQTKAMVAAHGLNDVINFVGFIDNKKIDAFYQKHDLFVLPSRSEPIGMVVYEAMSNGLPCIVSDSTGAQCSVFPGVNGYIFKTDNPIDLAEKILLMKDSERRNQFGRNSTKIIKNKHLPVRIEKKYARIFGLGQSS